MSRRRAQEEMDMLEEDQTILKVRCLGAQKKLWRGSEIADTLLSFALFTGSAVTQRPTSRLGLPGLSWYLL